MSTASVASWMSRPVHTVAPATLAGEAVALLRRHRIRHLPVMEGERVVGVVTDRDLRGTDPGGPVSAIMSRPGITTSPRTPIDRAARFLFDRRIGCLPVVEDGALVGILTQTDAVAALVELVRVQVGGPRAEVVVALRPDVMALAHDAIRPLGVEVGRLAGATRQPFGPGLVPDRVRLDIETRQLGRVVQALREAGLAVLSATDNGRG